MMEDAEVKMEVDTPSGSGTQPSVPSSPPAAAAGTSKGEDAAKYNLRTSSLINRIKTERKRAEPKSPKPKSKPPPLSKYRRKTANARERTRMLEINQAYEDLRQVVPEIPEDAVKGNNTKITTLRLALNYIAALRDILGYEDLYESESEYRSRSPSTSTASACSSPASSQGTSPPYPTGDFSDGSPASSLSQGTSPPYPTGDFSSPITPGPLDSEGESLASS